MPIINGQVIRARYTSLKLDEISSVDNPAQPGATASICKRFDPSTSEGGSYLARSIAKYVSTDDGAHTFTEVLRENKFSEAIWPLADALTQSIRSILGDTSLSAAQRDSKITTSVDEFLGAVRRLDPPEAGTDAPAEKVEKQLRELINKREGPTMKTVEQLNDEITALKGQVTTLTTERDTAVAAKGTAETALETEKAAHGETKKALVVAQDETIDFQGETLRKSEVGEAQFKVTKALIAERDMAVLEKRADSELGHLPGTASEKAMVLKHVAAMPEEARKAAEAILASAEKIAKLGFSRLGAGGEQPASIRKAQEDFNGAVTKIMERDKCGRSDAMRKARGEHPELFEAFQEAGQEAIAA